MCCKCLKSGENEMKRENALNVKVDEFMFRDLGKAANIMDVSQSEIVRRCIQLAMPILINNPTLVHIMPYLRESAIKER